MTMRIGVSLGDTPYTQFSMSAPTDDPVATATVVDFADLVKSFVPNNSAGSRDVTSIADKEMVNADGRQQFELTVTLFWHADLAAYEQGKYTRITTAGGGMNIADRQYLISSVTQPAIDTDGDVTIELSLVNARQTATP